MKHTKGNWNYFNEPDENGLQTDYYAVTNGDTCICISGEDNPNIGENLANAKLIAAAPELLEALEFICKKAWVKKGVNMHANLNFIRSKALEAIKKATE